MGPDSTLRHRSLRLGASVWLIALLFAGLLPGAPASQRKLSIKVEKKPKTKSPGHGSKPFDVTRHLIPLRDIQGGGPPRDGIPARDSPKFVTAAQADRVLRDSDVVLGVEFQGVAKAYPIRILNWHEIVNDEVGRQPALVTW